MGSYAHQMGQHIAEFNNVQLTNGTKQRKEDEDIQVQENPKTNMVYGILIILKLN